MSKNYNQVYKKFWKGVVEKDGEVDVEQVKKELYDYKFLLEEVPKVYCEVSKDKLSYPNYSAKTIIGELEDNFYDKEIVRDDLKSIWQNDGLTLKEKWQEVLEYFELLPKKN